MTLNFILGALLATYFALAFFFGWVTLAFADPYEHHKDERFYGIRQAVIVGGLWPWWALRIIYGLATGR